ncbi:hypothetical protein BGZ51_000266 [Haplosporangium sp. Z 767]|nr:hypothetical protein BGZ51_000266 [Haplosporangium sp. Z 767]
MTTSTAESSTLSEVPVLISGAGPVGTMAAIMFTRLGISCRLIERDMTVSPMSKALSMHARTLEVFEQTNLIQKFLDKGHPISYFNVYFNGVLQTFPGLINSISHYNYALFLEQVKTTAILNEELESHGLKVDRGWELMDTKVVEDGDKSWVETKLRRAKDGTNTRVTESKVLGVVELDAEQENKQYEYETVKSQYLIGADGGKSVVRHKVHIPFPGRTLDNNMILFDGYIETDLDVSQITVINGPNNKTMNVFPLSDGQVRIMVDGSDLDPAQELTLEALQEIAQATAAPSKFLIKSSSWLTFYRVNERRAESYSYKDRIFLAGDAAHVHSPAGGQGMNLGLQDAYNLTWKMALVIHGLADQRLLETYHGERAPVATNVIGMSSAMFAVGFSNQIWRRILRKIITFFASYLIRFISVPASRVSMLTIRYNENMINQRHKTQPRPKEEFQVGQRAHDGALTRVLTGGQLDEGNIRLHQLIHGPGTFHILVFTSDTLVPNASEPTSGVTTTRASRLEASVNRFVAQWRSKWAYPTNTLSGSKTNRDLFQVHVIAGAINSDKNKREDKGDVESSVNVFATKAEGEGRLYLDESKIVHERYGFEWSKGTGGIVVIRPDSHIGYRVNGAQEQAWRDIDEYFSTLLSID